MSTNQLNNVDGNKYISTNDSQFIANSATSINANPCESGQEPTKLLPQQQNNVITPSQSQQNSVAVHKSISSLHPSHPQRASLLCSGNQSASLVRPFQASSVANMPPSAYIRRNSLASLDLNFQGQVSYNRIWNLLHRTNANRVLHNVSSPALNTNPSAPPEFVTNMKIDGIIPENAHQIITETVATQVSLPQSPPNVQETIVASGNLLANDNHQNSTDTKVAIGTSNHSIDSKVAPKDLCKVKHDKPF